MKAYAIVIDNNATSQHGFQRLVESSQRVGNDFEIDKMGAVTPGTVDGVMEFTGVKWNYPWEGSVVDFASGMTKTAYVTANPKARMACAMSHYMLWVRVAQTKETSLILEHDALFVHKMDIEDVSQPIVGINNPIGATRRAQMFHDEILRRADDIQPVPVIDKLSVPQGLAGNSAYIITSAGAERMLDLVAQYGMWPNDALMCRQLVPGLSVTRKFYTCVQGLRSTTT